MGLGGAVRNERKDRAIVGFDVDNGRRLFFDAQEAKKVNERTVEFDEYSCI